MSQMRRVHFGSEENIRKQLLIHFVYGEAPRPVFCNPEWLRELPYTRITRAGET